MENLQPCHLCGGTGRLGDDHCPSPGCKIVRDVECLIGSYREELRQKNIRILKLEQECEDLAQMVLNMDGAKK